MSKNITIDKRLARESFARAATSYDEVAVLQKEVNRHLLERFDYINHTPQRILDVGCGTGFASFELHKRFKHADIVSLDLAQPMLKMMRAKTGLLTRMKNKLHLLNGDAENLPVANQSVDLVYSNLTIQWVNDLDRVLGEFKRVLKPGGMLLFSTFGPDTLKELRMSWQQVDQFSHVNRFVDMHDIGDALLRLRLAEPVMDVEHFTLTYPDVYKLMRDLKAIGAHNVTSERAKGLTGKQRMQQLQQAYENFRQNGLLPASYEVVYGHAWAAQSEQHGREQIAVTLESFHRTPS